MFSIIPAGVIKVKKNNQTVGDKLPFSSNDVRSQHEQMFSNTTHFVWRNKTCDHPNLHTVYILTLFIYLIVYLVGTVLIK